LFSFRTTHCSLRVPQNIPADSTFIGTANEQHALLLVLLQNDTHETATFSGEVSAIN